jgi:hypothetical protein
MGQFAGMPRCGGARRHEIAATVIGSSPVLRPRGGYDRRGLPANVAACGRINRWSKPLQINRREVARINFLQRVSDYKLTTLCLQICCADFSQRIGSQMNFPTPMCRACGVDRELVQIDRPNPNFDVPHFRCPKCRDILRLAVRHGDESAHPSERRY